MIGVKKVPVGVVGGGRQFVQAGLLRGPIVEFTFMIELLTVSSSQYPIIISANPFSVILFIYEFYEPRIL